MPVSLKFVSSDSRGDTRVAGRKIRKRVRLTQSNSCSMIVGMPQLLATVASLPRQDVVARLRAQVDALEGRARTRVCPAHPALAAVLPDGGLRPGAAYRVSGAGRREESAGALLAALLAEPSRAGMWCGVVGLPEFGAEAAGLAGVALDRLALVPAPGSRWLSVVAALAVALPVVAVRPSGPVRPADASRVAARLREHEAVLLVAGEWPGAEAAISLDEPRWAGVGAGWGCLAGREATVRVASKRYPRGRDVRVLLPGVDGRLAAAPDLAASAVTSGAASGVGNTSAASLRAVG